MRKNLFKIILMTSILATSLLVGCGEKDNNETTTPSNEVESTIVEDATTIVEETTSEESTNEVEEPTSPSEEATSEAPTTEEPTTTVEETTTSKVEETTKAPEPTTQAPTQAPTEAPTPAPSPSVSETTIKKIRSLHVAYVPKESFGHYDWDASQEMGAIVYVPGERKMADYVDSDCGDGTKPNPYTMYEWTTRKYYGDKDEVTLGFYCYKEDCIDNSSDPNGVVQTKAKEFFEAYAEPIGDGTSKWVHYDGICIKVGTYEGKDVYFEYYFLDNPSVE